MKSRLAQRIADLYRDQQRRDQPYEFAELAAYNARVSQGVVHTAQYVEQMRDEQARFDRAMQERYGR